MVSPMMSLVNMEVDKSVIFNVNVDMNSQVSSLTGESPVVLKKNEDKDGHEVVPLNGYLVPLIEESQILVGKCCSGSPLF